MKIQTKQSFLKKNTLPNVAIPHLLVYPRIILVDFLAQKVNFNYFKVFPIVKFVISMITVQCPVSTDSDSDSDSEGTVSLMYVDQHKYPIYDAIFTHGT